MSDPVVSDVAVDAATTVAPKAVEDESPKDDAPKGVTNEDILGRLDKLIEVLTPVPADASPTEPESHDAPDHGDVIPVDSSPAAKPWTHRGFGH